MDPYTLVSQRIATARRLTILTGAGISAASGVPTFRGPAGLWRSYRPERLATAEAFRRDPELVWQWYDWRRQLIARCGPNLGHDVIARWSASPGVTLVTQNVDGLHERAGTRRVVRYHGSLWRLACWTLCGAGEWEDLRVPLDPLPPLCPACGGLARPAVVWFGEPIPAGAAQAALRATACDVFLAIGTSGVVYPAAGLIAEARGKGAFTVEINPEPTGAAVDVAIDAPAEAALETLAALANR